ncbi:MAG: transcription-repair coupling factor [Bacilli bacterium]|jgi:transcription-repair coupling factor (superfamily II helicase)|nr:transcription-repair coupling factor [Bacilli bacterium]
MNFLGEIFKYENHARVCGLTSELQAQYYYHYFKQNDDNILIVTNSLYDSNKIYQKLKTYTDDVCLFPMDDFLSSVALAISPDLKVNRLETLEYLKNHDKTIVVTNLMGYLRFLPSYEKSQNLKVSLKKGLTIDRDKIVNELEEYGYVRTSLVTSTGEYALRGFIIDIFPIEADHPIRIELFGEEVEAIRVFNEETQLSINEISKIDILPIQELNFDEHSSLFEYMHNPFVFFINENQINNGYNKILKDIEEYSGNKDVLISDFIYSFEEINPNNYMYIETINNFDNSISFNSKEIIKFKGDYDTFKDFCLTHKNTNVVIICLSKDKQIDLVKELFSDVNIGSIKENTINILKFKLNEGFIIDKYMVISEFDIDNFKITNVYKNNFKIGRKIKGFEDIKIGDYVVHSQHGIGVYAGIEAITKNGLVKDYIKINYLGNDKIYIPVEKITTIYKYSDKDGTPPKLNKLNSTSWAKTKMKVRNRIKDISDELIKLYATRTSIKGPVFNNFDEEYTFAANFNYNETNDQLKTIKEIDNDLKSSIPMDRILCGDVGFGKTEVAFRGMFKTIVNGYQVAYLCPTTLLSRQQYNNALSRFREFPVNIALLNRFTSTKEVKRIYEGLKSGSIDIVFGTHKLLNKEIEFNNLGLLVVDEEQRFGVTHKERIKEIKNDVNVLTLSATPIPRTLKMAMSGLRDLSIIDTAPINRYPVQTYVVEEKEVLIKDAVYKELSRNGQVFVLYNRVSSIQDEVDKLSSLVPEARIVMAHGQMDKNELENIVSDFVDYKYDILVCTTIIETGIDIPNVNTLIVIDADNFGLSQLYQLRGRVGRSDKIAYAYLMYNPAKVLTETAIKRLQSIKDFTELGSGYKIAMRDLSIRGAGDLLGAEQAGFVDSVGLELYTQMVSEEIKRLNGEEVLEEENSNPLIEVANHISDEFVKEESIKIEIHQLINEIKDQTSLEKVKSEILDRFGNITSEMDIYMHEEWFSELANQLNIKRVKQTETLLELELPADISDKIQGDKLFLIAYNINPKFRLSYRMKKIYVSLSLVNLEKHFVYYLVPLLDEIKNMIA